MGAEERARKDALDVLELRWGPVERAGVYDTTGCPKCAAPPQALQKQWHAGFDVRDQSDLCRLEGEHLHGSCRGCQFQWREQVRDAEAEDRRVVASERGATVETQRKLRLVPAPTEV